MMTQGIGRLGVAALGVALATLTATGAMAQGDSCKSRGQLDALYCDDDGDLVADAPKDAKKWRDPSALVFAYTPVEDPAVYAKVWDGFLRHMEKVTGKRVQFFPVHSNAAQIEAMRAGRLHVAGFNTGSTPLAVNCAGFVPFTMMASLQDEFGYEMEIITYPGSGIETQ
jgi:phosphonate transport system substrate-binding protein